MKNILIDILALGTLVSSVLVITSKNPVIAVIFLISVFVYVAGYLILLLAMVAPIFISKK